jgi:hypothetical protein
MNWFGLVIGVSTLCIIGMGFAWVIRGERYFGYLWWPYVMGVGIILMVISVLVTNNYGSALLGAMGASLLWGSTELKEQAIRGELGWYPFRDGKMQPPFAKIIKKWKAPSL